MILLSFVLDSFIFLLNLYISNALTMHGIFIVVKFESNLTSVDICFQIWFDFSADRVSPYFFSRKIEANYGRVH